MHVFPGIFQLKKNNSSLKKSKTELIFIELTKSYYNNGPVLQINLCHVHSKCNLVTDSIEQLHMVKTSLYSGQD